MVRYNILIGGPAGTGPNILTHILGETLVKKGYYVFYSRDYQSLIRGGHNFNQLTFSETSIFSNDSQIDVLVCLDDKTRKLHEKKLKKSGILFEGEHPNMYFAGKLFKILCLSFSDLESALKKLEKRFEENIDEAKQGYNSEKQELCKVFSKKSENYFMNGNQGISQGALKSGVDVYYAYPMTPATPVLGELANAEPINGKAPLVLELENEIAVINAAIGSALVGKKAMVGTSGGGFDLMTEGLSLSGIAEIPVVAYLSQRPGPATGIATYTGQGDLQMARHSGHGEFSRFLVAPGDPKEAQELTSECFYFSQKFKIPAILLGDKHLAEALFTLSEKPKITKSEVSVKLQRYNSYETDSEGCATEDPEIISKNIEERKAKIPKIKKEAEKFSMYEIFGKKNSKNIILAYGSVKGAILDAIKDLDVAFLQIKYIEPFPEIKNLIQDKNLILVENNATGMLAEVLAEKTGIFINEKNKILRYDGRPFFADELKEEIQRRLGK